MANVELKKFEIFNLLAQNQYMVDVNAINNVGKLIEREFSCKLSFPLSEELKQDIKSKLISLKSICKKVSNGADRERFRKVLESQTFTIKVGNIDIIPESLTSEYAICREKLGSALRKNAEYQQHIRNLTNKIKQMEDGIKEIKGNYELALNEKDKLKNEYFKVNAFVRGHCLNESSVKRLQDATGGLIIHSNRKNYFDVGDRQRMRLRKKIKEILSSSTDFLKTMGLCVNKVEVVPIDLDEGDLKVAVKSMEECSADNEGPDVNKLLYYKDKFSISDRAYAGLKSKCLLNIPSLFMIKKRRGEIDQTFTLLENDQGVFVPLKQKIGHRLSAYFERKYGVISSEFDDKIFSDNIVHIKLAADGTNIGRNLKLLNFTFTILNEGARARTAFGNYTIGIFEIENENYENIEKCFKEIIEEIRELKEITVCNRTLKIVYYYAGDWKMLAQCMGILSANSKYPCVWCKCNKEDFTDLSVEWSIIDPEKGARCHDEVAEFIQMKSNTKNIKYGHDKAPIFRDIIPIHRYMIDMLHLFLRISDSLINLLVKDCSLLDKFEPWTISKFNLSNYKHLEALERFLNDKCGVNFKFLWVADSKRLTWRDLVGPEKVKLFEVFDLALIIPEHDKFDLLSKLWKDFYAIIRAVKLVEIEPTELKERTANWLDLFLQIYNKTMVTPYIHAFVSHLYEFVQLYKDINAFNLQGLERLNELTTGQYFKGTNKHDSALHQMLKKRNRMEYLRLFVDDTDLE